MGAGGFAGELAGGKASRGVTFSAGDGHGVHCTGQGFQQVLK